LTYNLSPNQIPLIVVELDEEHDHYMLNSIGWNDKQRIWNTIVFVRIKNAKFWIEIDGLEQGVATDLLGYGVPKDDIILAFHHPTIRPYTEFAVA